MSDKKHIDRLFQERFKDFEATPNDAVWSAIEAKLNEKKKKRRVIPIWWRYAGVAALLVLLLTIGGLYFNNNDTPTNPVVDTENKVDEKLNGNENNAENDAIETKTVITNDSNVIENAEKETETSTNTEARKLMPANTSSVANTPASKKNQTTTSSDSSLKWNKNKSENSNVAANNFSEEEKTTDEPISKNKNKLPESKTQVISKEKAKGLVNNTLENKTEIANNKEEVNKTKENQLTIEEALDKTKDALKDDENRLANKWSVAPNVAPVYFNTLGEGSSIDPQFNNNSKTGELNMSYGISASYAVNKKLKIRSGINKVNLGYNTNDIVVYNYLGVSSRSNALQNVNSGSQNKDLAILSSESLNSSDATQSLISSNTSINQAFGYIEVPLEIQYALTDKRLGLNLIGGFSSFFLDNNEIYSESKNGARIFLGEANNINKLSYSANFGLGLNYKMSKTMDLNLEPTFKYQFNTFNNTSGNFTPFFIGVYTGFAIKF